MFWYPSVLGHQENIDLAPAFNNVIEAIRNLEERLNSNPQVILKAK